MRSDVQLVLRPGIADLSWGHPDPALLPADALRRAAGQELRRNGPNALSYGAEQGPWRLLEPLAAWLSRREGAPLPPERLFITGGVSQALDLLCTLLTMPGDAVLVQSPVYHLALRIFRDHGLELVPVDSDEQGLRPDSLEAAVQALRRRGSAARFVYTVPTWCNPTGISTPAGRRAHLADIAQQAGLLIVEDDVYRELWYDAPSPPPVQALASDGTVVRLGSFSKFLAPGLRLGWLAGSPELVQRCVTCGMLDSGGGVNHFTAHVVAAYLAANRLDPHIEMLRAAYRARRDALEAALARHLPADCGWEHPGGGFFLWLRLPEGTDSAALLPAAEQAGVSYVPGARFGAGQSAARHARLSFSLLRPEELTEAARRLAGVVVQHPAARR